MRIAVRTLALVAVLIGALVATGGGPTRSASPSPAPSPAVGAPTATPASTPDPPPRPGAGGLVPGVLDWQPVGPPYLRPDRWFRRLIAWDGGFAVIEDRDERTAAVWRSPDGRTWTRSRLPGRLGPAWAFTPYRGGLLLAVDEPSAPGHRSSFGVGFWRSDDAVTWRRAGGLAYAVPDRLVRIGCQVNHQQVLTVSERIVVLGAICRDPCCGMTPPSGTAGLAMLAPAAVAEASPGGAIGWSCRDGRRCIRERVRGNPDYLQVTSPGAGGLIGIDGGADPRLLRSSDGLTWTTIAPMPDRFDADGQLLLGEAGGAPIVTGESFEDEGGYGNTMRLWRLDPAGQLAPVLRRQPAFAHSLVTAGDSLWIVGDAWGPGVSELTDDDDEEWAWIMGSADGGMSWPDALAWTGWDGSCVGQLAIHAGTAVMTACFQGRVTDVDASARIPAFWVSTVDAPVQP